jgi:hypothetical protein
MAALDATMAYLKDHTDSWYQAQWAQPLLDEQANVYGTSCCFAGFALLAHGYEIKWDNKGVCTLFGPTGDVLRHDGGDAMDDCDIPTVATMILGLGSAQCRRLFDGGNSLPGIRSLIERWRR